jgi:hypothetical protein
MEIIYFYSCSVGTVLSVVALIVTYMLEADVAAAAAAATCIETTGPDNLSRTLLSSVSQRTASNMAGAPVAMLAAAQCTALGARPRALVDFGLFFRTLEIAALAEFDSWTPRQE